MFDPTHVPEPILLPLASVVESTLAAADGLSQGDIMVVGAWCRDIIHASLGHDFATTATRDLDLGLALASWRAYGALTERFSRIGSTGIRYLIADLAVDLLPFGEVEEPVGTVVPPKRGVSMSVWAFAEVHAEALPLRLPNEITIRIPTVPGYAAANSRPGSTAPPGTRPRTPRISR